MTRTSLYRIGTLALALFCITLPFDPASGQAVTFESLLRGDSITVFDKVFSNFNLSTIVSGGAQSPNPANITVTPLADDPFNPGLLWIGGNSITLVAGPPAEVEA